MYPGSDDLGDYPEIYVGFNAGNFSFKQWYADSLYRLGCQRRCTPKPTTRLPIGEKLLAGVPRWLRLGRCWEAEELFDYAVQGNFTAGNFTIFGKFTGTDASEAIEVHLDVNNNEPRFLVGVMTTFPWGD